jgi:hypothetical protein
MVTQSAPPAQSLAGVGSIPKGFASYTRMILGECDNGRPAIDANVVFFDHPFALHWRAEEQGTQLLQLLMTNIASHVDHGTSVR